MRLNQRFLNTHPQLSTLMKHFLLSLLIASSCLTIVRATDPLPQLPSTPAQKRIQVGVFLIQPFAFKSQEDYSGFCVDLWRKIAADMDQPFDFVPFTAPSELQKAILSNQVDVALGNISITKERLKIVDFSQPFMQGGMQVMIDEKREPGWEKLWSGLADSGHLKIFAIGIAIIVFFTIVLTIFERKWNEEFHESWADGLAESFYHVMSITMTGKSSHKPLPGPLGRILAGIWLAFGVAVVAYITSSITSVMTVNRLQGSINGPQDLPGHRVGTLAGTLAVQYCHDQNLDTTLFSNLPDMVQALVRRKIDAIVSDAMTLQWYDNSHPELPITEVGPIFMKKGYGIALPLGSTLRHEINRALLQEQESGFVDTLRKHYFGDIP